jgi:hypothetical protein
MVPSCRNSGLWEIRDELKKREQLSKEEMNFLSRAWHRKETRKEICRKQLLDKHISKICCYLPDSMA